MFKKKDGGEKEATKETSQEKAAEVTEQTAEPEAELSFEDANKFYFKQSAEAAQKKEAEQAAINKALEGIKG